MYHCVPLCTTVFHCVRCPQKPGTQTGALKNRERLFSLFFFCQRTKRLALLCFILNGTVYTLQSCDAFTTPCCCCCGSIVTCLGGEEDDCQPVLLPVLWSALVCFLLFICLFPLFLISFASPHFCLYAVFQFLRLPPPPRCSSSVSVISSV